MARIKNSRVLADFSKDYNALRWFSIVVFLLVACTSLLVLLIFCLQYLGYTSNQLQWIPFFKIESFPLQRNLLEWAGMIILGLLSLTCWYMFFLNLLVGKIIRLEYDEHKQELFIFYNGALNQKRQLSLADIRKLQKGKTSSSPGSINNGQYYIPTLSFNNRRAYALIGGSNKHIFIFEHFNQSVFDKTFRELNVLINKRLK